MRRRPPRSTRTDTRFPNPPLFRSAPDHAVALFKELGPQEAARQMVASWQAFLEIAASTITIERRRGLDAARSVFVAMFGGKVAPAKGIVIEPCLHAAGLHRRLCHFNTLRSGRSDERRVGEECFSTRRTRGWP